MGRIKVIVTILIIAALVLLVPFNTVLTITDVKTDKPVLYVKVHDKDEFVISFIHSVNRRPVHDYIRVDGDKLTVFKSRYDTFGAGMPETSVDGKILKFDKDGLLELTGVNYTLPEILIFVGTVAKHSLSIKGHDIMLEDLVKPGEPLRFKIARLSYLQLQKGRCLDD